MQKIVEREDAKLAHRYSSNKTPYFWQGIVKINCLGTNKFYPQKPL